MVGAIHQWEIRQPPAAKLQEYLDLGWYRLDSLNGPVLRWSFGKGTPQLPACHDPQRNKVDAVAYEFRTQCIPGVIVRDSYSALVSYRNSSAENWLGAWGGVMDKSIAHALRPWSAPVLLEFTAYRVGDCEWREIEEGQVLWGCLLKGPRLPDTAVFAVVEAGWPIVATLKNK